jgi:hypothetical protein
LSSIANSQTLRLLALDPTPSISASLDLDTDDIPLLSLARHGKSPPPLQLKMPDFFGKQKGFSLPSINRLQLPAVWHWLFFTHINKEIRRGLARGAAANARSAARNIYFFDAAYKIIVCRSCTDAKEQAHRRFVCGPYRFSFYRLLSRGGKNFDLYFLRKPLSCFLWLHSFSSHREQSRHLLVAVENRSGCRR